MSTQTRRPWRTTARTVFQGVVGLSASWALIVQALGLDPAWQWVAVSLTITAAVTRVMALPAVDDLLTRFVPFLAADPGYWGGHAAADSPAPHSDKDN